MLPLAILAVVGVCTAGLFVDSIHEYVPMILGVLMVIIVPQTMAKPSADDEERKKKAQSTPDDPTVATRQWGKVRPLGITALPIDVLNRQAAKLRAARDLAAIVANAKYASDDIIEMSHAPDADSALRLSVTFMDDDEVYFAITGSGFPLGLLACLALLHRIDAILGFLPDALREVFEHVSKSREYAPNQALHLVRTAAVGPLPPMEAAIDATLYDVADDPKEKGTVLVHLQSRPPPSTTEPVPCTLEPRPSGCEELRGLEVAAWLAPSDVAAPPEVDGAEGAAKPADRLLARLDFQLAGKATLPVPRAMLPTKMIHSSVQRLLQLLLPAVVRFNAAYRQDEASKGCHVVEARLRGLEANGVLALKGGLRRRKKA